MSNQAVTRYGSLMLVVLTLSGCVDRRDKKDQVASSSSAVVVGASGDRGTVEGTVSVEGDPPPLEPNLEARIPTECEEARRTYRLLFREGAGRRIADVFVGVTGYQGAPGARQGAVEVTARGCAWSRRTYGLMPGQHLLVKNLDQRPYVPSLVGAKTGASLVAVPGGDAVPVYPKGPGMYVLVDEMRNFTQATVLVVGFPTFDVTGLDGRFRIEGVPIGTATLSAYLPTATLKAEQKITVTKDRTTRVDLKLHFDAAAYQASQRATAPSAMAPVTSGASSPAPTQ